MTTAKSPPEVQANDTKLRKDDAVQEDFEGVYAT